MIRAKREIREFGKQFKKLWPQPDTINENSSCVIVGPMWSGKTALLFSIMRCYYAGSHSYQPDFDVGITDPGFGVRLMNDANESGAASAENQTVGLSYYTDQIRDVLLDGLNLDATRIQDFTRVEFTLSTMSKRAIDGERYLRKSDDLAVTFTTFDGSGGLLLQSEQTALTTLRTQDERNRYYIARKALVEDLQGCRDLIICLPIDHTVDFAQLENLNNFIAYLGRALNSDRRRILVCFTKYEKEGIIHGCEAYYRLSMREEAKVLVERAMSRYRTNLAVELRKVAKKEGNVWFAPVSAYGFIPGNGGSNLAPNGAVLRTRPFDDEPKPGEVERGWSLRAPYDYRAVSGGFWQPFLTLDPFIFLATGYRDKERHLIFNINELSF